MKLFLKKLYRKDLGFGSATKCNGSLAHRYMRTNTFQKEEGGMIPGKYIPPCTGVKKITEFSEVLNVFVLRRRGHP